MSNRKHAIARCGFFYLSVAAGHQLLRWTELAIPFSWHKEDAAREGSLWITSLAQ